LALISKLKVMFIILHNRGYRGALHLPGLEPVGDEPLMSVTCGQCDARLLSQPQGITARFLVPNYAAWWQRHTCVNNLPRVALDRGFRTFGDSNRRPIDRKSSTLPLCHQATQDEWCITNEVNDDESDNDNRCATNSGTVANTESRQLYEEGTDDDIDDVYKPFSRTTRWEVLTEVYNTGLLQTVKRICGTCGGVLLETGRPLTRRNHRKSR